MQLYGYVGPRSAGHFSCYTDEVHADSWARASVMGRGTGALGERAKVYLA